MIVVCVCVCVRAWMASIFGRDLALSLGAGVMRGGGLGGARGLCTMYAIVRHLRPLGSLWLRVPNRARWYTIGDRALLWRARLPSEVCQVHNIDARMCRARGVHTICAIIYNLEWPVSFWPAAPDLAAEGA